MATANKVIIGIDDTTIELKGAEKEAFELDRKQMVEKAELFKQDLDTLKAFKVSAYTKLGLTEEEINAIL
jgi:hypothetical protein